MSWSISHNGDSVKGHAVRYDTAITTGEGQSMREAVSAGAIASVLHESCHIVIARALKVLGQERCITLLVDALTIESNGGMWLKDGSRKRTLGGVFLALCKQHSTQEEQRRIFR